MIKNKEVIPLIENDIKKYTLRLLSSVLFLILAASCKTNTIYSNCFIDSIIPKGNEKYITEYSDYIFDQHTLHTFELTISEEDFEKIDSDPAAEQYVAASLRFNGEELSPVGIRYKGSIGAFVGALSGNDWANPSGHKTATKLSMKIKIDWNDPNRTFYGLKKLQFHSQNNDASQMHERLGYWLYREMGVPAPRSVHARLIINGVYYGVYALTEQIDEQFIAYNYKDTVGNLYKEIWPINYLGEATDHSDFIANLKTNKTEGANTSLIENFANDIIASNEEELSDLIKQSMYLNQIMSYIVVDRMIRNDDGAFHWYCNSEGCDNHNYYWYEEPSTQKFHLIPWDLDHAFQNIGRGKNAVTRIHNTWGEISNDCMPFNSYARGMDQKSAACDKLTGGWASFNQEYETLKTKFIAGPFSEEIINAKIDEWSAQIRAATLEAENVHRDAISETEWNAALENLKGEVSHSRLDY
jgi:spore coat protein CotH